MNRFKYWIERKKSQRFFELLDYWEHDPDFENVLVFYLSLKNTVMRLEEKYGDKINPMKIIVDNYKLAKKHDSHD